MDKVAYAALIAFGAFTTGMAAMAAYFYAKAAFILGRSDGPLKGHRQRHVWLAVTKVGIVVTQGVLLYRVITAGQLDANPAAFWYLFGLLVTGVGVFGQCAMLYKDMPVFEAASAAGKEEDRGTEG